jgi:hypothetical protein
MIYKTKIRNETNASLTIPYDNGAQLNVNLSANAEMEITSEDPGYMFAPFIAVTFRDGKTELKENKEWKNPFKDGLYTVFLNTGGVFREVFALSGESVLMIKGVPRYVQVNPLAWWSRYSKVEISTPFKIEIPDRTRPGYIKTEERPNIIYTKRPEAEIEQIKKLRVAERERI